ncbi:lytic transglycosylase domain-containing protein [Phreatobacter sp.]|uniref:lytic transglycosylase domain-containing protein n=1 Tax=Phreatobacter sp. TaxID=1966341 RepID=UPI003F70BC0E
MFLFRSSAETPTRPTSAAEAGANRVMSAIRSAADRTGAGFDYLLRTARRESSLQPEAQAPTSSARGLFQFIDSTWLTMVRDEGRNLGLQRYAEQIGSSDAGRPVVSDPAMRRQILALRDDPAVSALVAGAFTNRNATELRSAIGRNPTEGELYMAHFLGSGGAGRLIGLNQSSPQISAATQFPDAAGANRRIFFDRGRPRTVAEVYGLLAGSQSRTVAATTATTAGTAPATRAGAPAAGTAEAEDPGRGSWSSVAQVRADPNRPFHSMFSTNGAGPINAFVAATWAALGRPVAETSPTVTTPASITPASITPASMASSPNSDPRAITADVGGPFYPVQIERMRRGQPLDLGQFLVAPARR